VLETWTRDQIYIHHKNGPDLCNDFYLNEHIFQGHCKGTKNLFNLTLRKLHKFCWYLDQEYDFMSILKMQSQANKDHPQ